MDALLAKMSLDDKIGQLNQAGAIAFGPNAPKIEDVVRKGGAGSVLWLNDTKRFNALQKIAVEESPSKIPLLFGLDVIHGYQTIFPVPLAMASSWDPALAERAQTVAAREARAAGLQWTFGPMVDIARDARWGRIVEGAGEDPYLGSAMAAAQVRGFQGPSLSAAEDRVVASVKHYAGYGAADGGRDYDPVYLSEAQLRNVYLPPFHAAAKAGAGTFMSAYMDLNNVPATGTRSCCATCSRASGASRASSSATRWPSATSSSRDLPATGAMPRTVRCMPASTWTWRAARTRRTSPGWSRTARSRSPRSTTPCGAS